MAPTRLRERVAFEGKLFTVKDIDFLFSSGKKATYQVIESADSSLVVPLDERGNVLFIREYFPAVHARLLSLPKGRIEKRYSPAYTANKELQEEVGVKARTLVKLGVLSISPGYQTHATHVFLAQHMRESKRKGDEEEPIEVVRFPLSRFEELVDSGQLSEARMIAALYLARRWISSKKDIRLRK